MRLHRLRLRALGPFAQEQHIDFDRLGAGGLFLLDGPTGAGKSTVLDAITFALYGPGERGGDGRLHSQFAQPGVAPEVELEFSVRGRRQRVTRSPEFARPKRRGIGSTLEPARVHLERLERESGGERWVSRSSNKAEVADLLADDIGLTREQFTQVVLLPQGEFMTFLRAGDDERRALLTKLFGTQLYDRITDELQRRSQVTGREVDEAARRLQSRLAAAGAQAGLGGVEVDELAELPAAERDARLDALSAALQQRAEAARAAQAATSVTAEQARAEAARVAGRADRLARLCAALADLARHEQTRPGYEQAREVLARAHRAEPVRPLLAALDESVRAHAKALRALPAEGLELDPAIPAQLAARAARQAAELSGLVGRERELASRQARLAEAQDMLAAARARIGELAERRRELPGAIAATAAAVRAAGEQAAAADGLGVRRERMRGRLEALLALRAQLPVLETALLTRQAAVGAHQRATDEHQRLLQLRLDNMAAELAAGLHDGGPCPVCGSAVHPAPAAPEPGAVGAAAVSAALERRQERADERTCAERAVAELERQRASLLAQAELAADAADAAAAADAADRTSALTEQIRGELAELDEAVLAARRSVEHLPELEEQYAELVSAAAQLDVDQQAATTEAATLQERVDAAESALQGLRDELAEAAGGHASVAARQQALLAVAAHHERIAELCATARGAEAALAQARSRVEVELVGAGFDDEKQARAAVLAREQLDELEAVVQSWATEGERLRGALEAAEFAPSADPAERAEFEALAELAASRRLEAALTARDVVQAAAATAATDADQAEAAARSAAVAAEQAARALAGFTTAVGDVCSAAQEHDEVVAAAAPVTYLAKLAQGKSGNRRVTLTTYVLRQWFEQVVRAANLRLAGMSSGRYELVRVDEGSRRTERAGLTLQVLDQHTGEQRSPRSLSGGETFYTSLALALGLADVVRAEAGGVELDTLFIDEGFGSLDADTLDQVMEVIDELRDGGRTVGVVSHVAELKHRIGERIEVRRLPDGSSALRVVA